MGASSLSLGKAKQIFLLRKLLNSGYLNYFSLGLGKNKIVISTATAPSKDTLSECRAKAPDIRFKQTWAPALPSQNDRGMTDGFRLSFDAPY